GAGEAAATHGGVDCLCSRLLRQHRIQRCGLTNNSSVVDAITNVEHGGSDVNFFRPWPPLSRARLLQDLSAEKWAKMRLCYRLSGPKLCLQEPRHHLSPMLKILFSQREVMPLNSSLAVAEMWRP